RAEDHGAVQGVGRRLLGGCQRQPGHHQSEAEDVGERCSPTALCVSSGYSRGMPFTAQFRCIAGCAGSYPLEQVIYRCPTCGDLLEVVNDMAALRERSAGDWKKLFGERWRSVEEPYGSGVWGKHEWVAPQLATSNIVSMLEGVT